MVRGAGMTWCPAHGNRTGLAPPAPQPDCRRTRRPTAGGPTAKGAQHKGGCGDLAGRRKNWGSLPLPEAPVRHGPIHAQSAWLWSELQGKQATQAGGLGLKCGSAEEPCMLSSLPRIDYSQPVSTSTRNDFGFLCGRRRVLLSFSEDPPI